MYGDVCYHLYMTGRTHDLAAFTALNIAFVYTQPTDISLATTGVAMGANMIGGLLPDIDNTTSDIWDKVRGGNILAKLIKPLVGKHRMLSHSILGMVLAGYLLQYLLNWAGNVLLVDMHIVWWATMIGFFSHLVADSITKQGVPWLFPIPYRIGIPPIEFLRIKTGGILEKSLIFPGLIFYNGYLLYQHSALYIAFVKGF
jgi:inner membrane protein